MLRGQDLDEFKDYLKRKWNWLMELGKEISDKEFIVDVLNKIPDDYDNVIE